MCVDNIDDVSVSNELYGSVKCTVLVRHHMFGPSGWKWASSVLKMVT